jgi:hypothetical protein
MECNNKFNLRRYNTYLCSRWIWITACPRRVWLTAVGGDPTCTKGSVRAIAGRQLVCAGFKCSSPPFVFKGLKCMTDNNRKHGALLYPASSISLAQIRIFRFLSVNTYILFKLHLNVC